MSFCVLNDYWLIDQTRQSLVHNHRLRVYFCRPKLLWSVKWYGARQSLQILADFSLLWGNRINGSGWNLASNILTVCSSVPNLALIANERWVQKPEISKSAQLQYFCSMVISGGHENNHSRWIMAFKHRLWVYFYTPNWTSIGEHGTRSHAAALALLQQLGVAYGFW